MKIIKNLKIIRMAAVFVLTTSLLGGCSIIDKTSGLVIDIMATRTIVPYTMSTEDLDMACSTAQGLQAMVLAFTRVGNSPDRNGILMNMLAGTCAELNALEDELAYTRAFRGRNFDEARDARIRVKRHFAVASHRKYEAWKYLEKRFGEVGGDSCPILNKNDQFYWVVGIVSGIQAVAADLRAQGASSVPKDIAVKGARGLQCVDDQDFWGLPSAARAAVAVLLPDDNNAALDPWQLFEKATRYGDAQGVRLANAVQIITADSVGEADRLKAAIRDHANSLKNSPVNNDYQLLDVVASTMTYAISDRLWTEATGSRTPMNQLGVFWDDKNNSDNEDQQLDVADLLEGL